jgi:hypothetical protein
MASFEPSPAVEPLAPALPARQNPVLVNPAGLEKDTVVTA